MYAVLKCKLNDNHQRTHIKKKQRHIKNDIHRHQHKHIQSNIQSNKKAKQKNKHTHTKQN
jgi:hypothetical protein